MLFPRIKPARASVGPSRPPVAQVSVATRLCQLSVCLFAASLTIVGMPRSVDAEQRNAPEEAALREELAMTEARRVCADKKVPINEVGHMLNLLRLIQAADERLCPERYLSSVAELAGLLKVRPDRLCEAAAIQAIADFHFRFIAPKREVRGQLNGVRRQPIKEIVREQLHPEPARYSIQLDQFDQPLMIPIALRHFFLKWALQVSGQCKRDLLDNLEREELRLRADDRALVELFDRSSPLGALLDRDMELINFENAVYLPELEGERPEVAGGRQVHIKSSAGEGSSLYELAVACQARLRPIYQELVLPIVRLSKLGYDYLGDQLTADQLARLAGPQVKAWLGVVHVCELFDKVLVVEGAPEVSRQSEEREEEAEEEDEGEEEVAVMSEGEVERLQQVQVRQLLAEPVPFKASLRSALVQGQLWICDERQLDLELARRPGAKDPRGFGGFLRRARRGLRRELAKLDFKRFAHYRRHSAWYSGVLNFISSCSNVASIVVTLVFTFGAMSVGR